MEKIGLIAGNRRFPILVATEARKQGVPLVAVAVKGETDASLGRYVDKVIWLSLGDFNRMSEVFKAEGVTRVIMAGQISPARLFSKEVAESTQIQQLLAGIRDRRANSIFAAIAQQLSLEGITLIDSTTFVKEYLPKKGILTKRQPSEAQWQDIRFGIEIAKKIASLDIGLSVGIKDKAIVAVEALEGTDNLILRAGRIARTGVVIAKVGRPSQDMRFDIPVIGLNTVKTLLHARASCMAIEAEKTLCLDMQDCIALADAKNLSLIAV